MTRAAALILSAFLVSGAASAQVYDRRGYDPGTDDRYRAARATQVDEARVIRVDPVFEQGDRYDAREGNAGYADGVQDGDYRDGYSAGGYSGGNYSGGPYPGDVRSSDGYADGGYADGNYGTPSRCRTRRDDAYAETGAYDRGGWQGDGYRESGTTAGSENGRTMATVIGGVLGAVVGSQVGGGSGRFATSAIGTMVGGIAGREVYEAGQRNRMQQGGLVTVCDPVPVEGRGYDPGPRAGGNGVDAYDVTYEYAGRQYTTRTRYHPGDTIRVRVDISPDE